MPRQFTCFSGQDLKHATLHKLRHTDGADFDRELPPGQPDEGAVMEPAGMFAGTPQMVFHVTMEGWGGLHVAEEVKVTVRGKSESKNVADGMAKKVAKRFEAERKG